MTKTKNFQVRIQLKLSHLAYLYEAKAIQNKYKCTMEVIYLYVNRAIYITIVITKFSGGRSRSTRREPPIMGKQLVNFITCGCESSECLPPLTL
jgi:hypothetical protein